MKNVYVVAGEASGDLLGAKLLKSLHQRFDGNITFHGIGGKLMEKEGVNSLFPMEDLSVMGFTEVFWRLPLLLKRLKETEEDIKKIKPDALITIDAPGFNFRLAKKLQYHNFPIIHYVAPSVWAWRKDRARKCAQFLDHLLTLLPFEPPYFEEHNLSTTFVGHAILESGADQGQGTRFREKHNIPQDLPLVALLPGSRMMEISKLAPLFAKTFEKLHRLKPDIKAIIPVLPHLLPMIKPIFRRQLGVLYEKLMFVKDQSEKYDAMAACNVALAASGTVTLELAMAKVPMIVAYKLNPLSAFLAKRVLTLKYVTLINILQDKEIIPEFLQDACTADNLALSLEALLQNSKRAEQQIAASQEALLKLRAHDMLPSERASETIFKIMGG